MEEKPFVDQQIPHAEPALLPNPPTDVDFIEGLITRAKTGDASVLPELRDALAD